MDYDKYKDIAPYRGEDFAEGVKRLTESPGFLYGFVSMLNTSGQKEDTDKYFSYILNNVKNVKNYTEFQHNVTAGVMVPEVIKRTMSEFTVSGIENIDNKSGYLFVSNHRDIILDCALLDYALLSNGKPLCEMAFGDNLNANKFVEDLFRLNGGIVVRRNMSMRAKFLETMKLSEYINAVIREENISVWIAERPGRCRDGIDLAQESIVKMLSLSRKGKEDFNTTINCLNIVPVAVSYEWDPNDINKARTEVKKMSMSGDYEKKKLEDVISMTRGMKKNKGRVHLSISAPLKGDFDSPASVTEAIDRAIHSSYRLWENNYFAYDYLEGTDKYKKETGDFDSESFLSAIAHLSPEVRDFLLNTYANPVRMKERV